MEKFKDDYIVSDIIATEKKECSMIDWVAKLPMHRFDRRHFEEKDVANSPIRQALMQIGRSKRAAAADDDELECGGDDDEDDAEQEVKRSRVEKDNL